MPPRCLPSPSFHPSSFGMPSMTGPPLHSRPRGAWRRFPGSRCTSSSPPPWCSLRRQGCWRWRRRSLAPSPRTPASGDAPRQRLFLNTAILVPLSVFAVFSLRHEVKLDWTGAPWVAALPVMAAGMIRDRNEVARTARMDPRGVDADTRDHAADLRRGPALSGAGASRARLRPAHRTGSGRLARPQPPDFGDCGGSPPGNRQSIR